MSKNKNEVVTHEPPLIFASLRERLDGIKAAADAAWAAKAAIGFRNTAVAIGAAVQAFEVRSAEIASEEDALRLRGELTETLRSAAAAVAPRAS